MLKTLAEAQQGYVVGVRRELHRIPELRWEERQTLSLIRAEIYSSVGLRADLGVSIREFRGGLVVDITINPTFDRIIFRADVDALPIPEATGLPFASTNGCSHACGHDTHSAMLLGFLRAIMSTDVALAHNLRLVWQRAEENPTTKSGGDVLVTEEGVCDGISAAYGLHIWATGRPGVFYSRPGAFLGNSGRIGVRITGKGGHVAMPQNAVNPIRIGYAVMAALDGFQAATLGPLEPGTLEPVIFQSGSASNVIPSEATLWYGVRTMLPRDRHMRYLEQIQERVRRVTACFEGATVTFELAGGHPALINNSTVVEYVAGLLDGAGEAYEEHPAILGGEDFAHYLMKVPGAFIMLGAGGHDSPDHHHPGFNPSEEEFHRGVHLWLLLATT